MSSGETGSVVTLSVIGASATVLAVAAEKSFTINREAASIATDAKGDTSVTNSPGRVNQTCSVDSLYVHSDAAQARLISLMDSNTQVTLEIERDNSAYQSATATITSLSINHSDLEAATFSAEFDIDGLFA